MWCHMADTHVDRALATLEGAGNRIKCSELTEFLESLGFYFKSKKTKGHKVFFHDGLPNFSSMSFNCEHSKDPEVKAPYVQRVRRELRNHRDDLNKYLEMRARQ